MDDDRAVGDMRPRSVPSDVVDVADRFSAASILVIGDVMLDEYIWGAVTRISPEAPVPVVEFAARTYVAGGAANAAANVAALGGSASIGSVVGRDREADLIRAELTSRHIESTLIATDRPTTTKTRVLGGSQQILRIDREARDPVGPDERTRLLEWATAALPSVDVVLVSDYGKGVVTKQLCRDVIDVANTEGKHVIIDPKGRDYSKYEGATVVTPNADELSSAVEMLGGASEDLEEDLSSLRSVLPGSAIAVTRGSEGVVLCEPNGPLVAVHSRARTVFDVTGAGDTFVATLALGLAVGADLVQAATIANAAAGLSVGTVGTRAVEREELLSELSSERSDPR